jgi:hypothetical protein
VRPPEVRSRATAPAEPAPVRIHIGRLEVRASLEPDPPSRRAPARGAEPPQLSLSAYLNGEREAR